MGLALFRVGRVYCPGRAIVDPVSGDREIPQETRVCHDPDLFPADVSHRA